MEEEEEREGRKGDKAGEREGRLKCNKLPTLYMQPSSGEKGGGGGGQNLQLRLQFKRASLTAVTDTREEC